MVNAHNKELIPKQKMSKVTLKIQGNRKSTPSWKRQSRDGRLQTIERVCQLLDKKYGKLTHGNFEDPLDELIYIILTNRTTLEVAQRTFAHLKSRFPNWTDVLTNPLKELRNVLAPAGLSRVKSRQIRAILVRLREDFGYCDLKAIQKWEMIDVENYLVTLPGVSTKVARCVMMYSLRADVLPVDTHVHRVSRRLGWIHRKRADQCHQELDELIPESKRYAFHVGCVALGREICRSDNPSCNKCFLRQYCDFAKG